MFGYSRDDVCFCWTGNCWTLVKVVGPVLMYAKPMLKVMDLSCQFWYVEHEGQLSSRYYPVRGRYHGLRI